MEPLTWNDLPSIHDVRPIDDADRACLDEIRGVVERHGKVNRYGVALLHQHFELREGEVLVEHCDLDARTLSTAPQAATSEVLERYIPTIWRFDGHVANACSYCPTHGNQHDGHKESH